MESLSVVKVAMETLHAWGKQLSCLCYYLTQSIKRGWIIFSTTSTVSAQSLPETRKDTFHRGENAQGLIAGKWQSWWVNTGLLTSKSHTLLGSLITWRPFPFRNEVCCPVSRIGLHSVPCRWLEPHIHTGWFTLYLHSHSFPISRLVASPLAFVLSQCHADP